jgi:hypothetical protein
MTHLPRFVPTLAALALLLLPSAVSHSQTVATQRVTPAPLQTDSPFGVTGFIQQATPDAPNDIFSGGSLTVNGLQISVPRNTLFQFPATAMTWQEMFKLAPPPYGLNTPSGPQSGLALSDSPAPFATYEVTVIGNRIIHSATDDKYIAAFIFLSQQSLNVGQGFINAIDYQTGELWVGSALESKTGARIQLNLPKGRYGIAHSPDVRFTADEDNPTIHAITGYPMCISRTDPVVADDPLCPQRNRPIDPVTKAYSTLFTMPAPGPTLAPTDPDAAQQAPFEVGDWVEYSGTLLKDAAGQQYISAHTVIANLGIFTAPGVMPAYVTIEAMSLGVGGTPNPLFPQEAVEKLTMVAFTTDPTSLVDIYAVDVDACGKESNRFYSTGDPFGPPVSAKKGRAVVRTFIGDFLPATREMRVASRTLTKGQPVDSVLATAQTYANGLIAGQYHAPNFDYLFPESLVIGGPPVPSAFEEFPFLANGSGPYFGSGPNANTAAYGNLGQLSPWPGQAAPQPLGCGPAGELKAPVANAGPAVTVNAGATVILDGTASSDPNSPPLPLSYTWLQTDGLGATLNDNATAHPFFTAPSVAAGSPPVKLTFSLVVTNGFTTSPISTVDITVTGQQTPLVNAGANQQVNSAAAVTLTGSANDPAGAAGQPLSYQWTQTAGPTVTLSGANTATATFTAPTMTTGQGPLSLGFKLTVTNALGASGSATTSVTVQPIRDTVTIGTAIWRARKSQLSVTAVSSVSNGSPVLTLHIPGHADVPMVFDPATKTYVAGAAPAGQLTVNPAPSTISVTSSFGGSASSPVTIR